MATLPILGVVLLPVGSICVLAAGDADGVWSHLSRTVLPSAVLTTLQLCVFVATLTLFVGTGAAWLITMYRFPGRNILDLLLVLPLAMPTYIVAYCYSDLLDYAGPIQSQLRAWKGWTSASDYVFPEIRSTTGAAVILASVLYPYVYLAARASFVQQSICVLEVARTLGRTPIGAFWSVALPLSRPALAAGVALVLMECLNDLGAVQHLGVQSMTSLIYATWLQRSSLVGASQIAVILLAVILPVFALERIARGQVRVQHTTGRYRAIPFQSINGWRGYLAAAVCCLPFVAGFAVPMGVLVQDAIRHADMATSAEFLRAAANSVVLATAAALLCLLMAMILTYGRRIAPGSLSATAVLLGGLGYAVPGTILAIGLLIPLAAFDNALDAALRAWFGVSTGLLLSGSIACLTLVYAIRFLAIALGSLDASLQHVSTNLDAAARALGETAFTSFRRVHIPLLVPAASAAALLVFVDSMKELPATLLLRPFNFDTLATHVYSYAALEQFDEAAPGALAIVLVGLAPILLLHSAVARGRAGSTSHAQ